MNTVKATIYDEVTQITPYDDVESAHIADIQQWIKSNAPLFRISKPDNPPKHLVAYFVLVDPDSRSILLVDHIKAQKWLPTGGHAMNNEDLVDTVIREADEELNLQAIFLKNQRHPFFATVTITGGLTPGHTDVSLWYLLHGHRHDFVQYDKSEFTDVEWFTFDEILESDPVIFDPHLQRFTRKLQAYLS